MPNNEYSKFGASLKLTHDFNKHLRIYGDIYANIRDDRTTASIVDPLEYATFANPYERLTTKTEIMSTIVLIMPI